MKTWTPSCAGLSKTTLRSPGPDGRLWWGIGILIVFTLLGVVIPLGVMTAGPHDLAQVRWVFYPFIVSLLALIGYIVVYLVQLTRSKRDQPTAPA